MLLLLTLWLVVLAGVQVLQVVEHMMLDCHSKELKDHQLSIICWAAVKQKCLTRSLWDLISPAFCPM